MNRLQILREVLAALYDCDGIPVSQETLFSNVRMVTRPAPLQSELREAVDTLEAQGMVIATRDTLDQKSINWTITPKGRAEHLSRK